MRKFFIPIITTFLFVILGFIFFFFFHFYHSKPKISGKISVEGLISDVRIATDEWGVPHVFAQNEKDLFFACGYVHASERMWQMDITRRAGFGQLSEIVGQDTLDRDRIIRNLGLKEAAVKDFEMMSSPMKELLYAYCAGINSWLDSRKFNWPPEFLILRYRPRPWNPLDSLIVKQLMSLLLCVDYPSEVVRGNLAERLGSQKALQILEKEVKKLPSVTEKGSLANWKKTFFSSGSNNWVVDGNRSETGMPLLANDPHLEISLPPIWYEIHLNCLSINAVGVSLPGVPLVIIGHNDSIAWGITNSAVDAQDLYMEKLNSSQDMYLEGDEWKPLRKKEELIRVKGQVNPERMEIDWTARGPIITPRIIEADTPFSLSWTIYEGGEAFEGFYLLNKAKTWPDFSEALKCFNSPSQNFVYADKEGNIGYYLSGRIPLRKEEAALFPFPGWLEEGKWQGFLEENKKPNLFNPEEGFIVTANNRIAPNDYPHYLSVDWDAPFRAERIKELLLQRKKHSVDSFQKIQNDIFSKKGELFFPFVKKIKANRGDLKKALDIIKNWDLLMTSGKEPAIYKVFMNKLAEEVFKDELGDDFQSFDILFRRKEAGLLRILADSGSLWFDKKDTDMIEKREDILKLSLERAYEWLDKEYGSPDNWDWMTLHSIRFEHALGRIPYFRFFNRGPFPVSGDAFTVRASYSPGFKTTYGASYRQIVDLSDWDKSICVLTSGQSGHFLSRYYDDQIPLWLVGQYHPMLFGNEKVKESTRDILILKPEKEKE